MVLREVANCLLEHLSSANSHIVQQLIPVGTHRCQNTARILNFIYRLEGYDFESDTCSCDDSQADSVAALLVQTCMH